MSECAECRLYKAMVEELVAVQVGYKTLITLYQQHNTAGMLDTLNDIHAHAGCYEALRQQLRALRRTR